MIDPNESVYYLVYAGAVAALGVLYIKVKSTEAMVITTKEFKSFQWSFLVAYSLITLGETVAAASFYVTLMHAQVPLEQITTMYVVTVASTTFFNSFLDIVDIGTRKNKCTLSAVLFAGSMFTLFFTEHEGLYLLGRVAYGAAYSLLNSAFNSYLVQQHTTMGFPDDWLAHTFTVLTHTMAAVTAGSGVLGQVASSSGTFGCVTVSMFLFAAAALYMTGAWEGDFAGPRFMLSNFTFSMGQTLRSLQVGHASFLSDPSYPPLTSL